MIMIMIIIYNFMVRQKIQIRYCRLSFARSMNVKTKQKIYQFTAILTERA